MYFHVCETQRTRMHVTDTTATPNGHQMAVVTWDRSITRFPVFVISLGWAGERNKQLTAETCDHEHRTQSTRARYYRSWVISIERYLGKIPFKCHLLVSYSRYRCLLMYPIIVRYILMSWIVLFYYIQSVRAKRNLELPGKTVPIFIYIYIYRCHTGQLVEYKLTDLSTQRMSKRLWHSGLKQSVRPHIRVSVGDEK